MKTTADGIVIWEVKTGEADRIITVLTADGVISAYAAGSRRPKNKLTSPTSMLSFSNFELNAGKNMFRVADAMPAERFLSLSADVERYSLAVYFCELLKNLAPIDEDASEFLSLMFNSLHLLDERKKNILLIKAVFELRIMSLSGYMPDLSGCAECGSPLSPGLFFDITNGIWYCDDCSRTSERNLNCSSALLSAMRHIIFSEKQRLFSFEMSEKPLIQLGKLTSSYVVSHIERLPTTLDFLNKLLKR